MTSQGDLFGAIAKRMRADFEGLRRITHSGERGRAVEEILREFLRRHLPGRYAVGTGFLVAPEGTESRQCDIIIYDRLDTPILLGAGDIVMVPTDCALAVIEVKSALSRQELTGNEARGKKKVKGALHQVKSARALAYQTSLNKEFKDPKPLGFVFGFDPDRKMELIAADVKAFREGLGRDQATQQVMANGVCVLDRGLVCYYDSENSWFQVDPTFAPNSQLAQICIVEAGRQTLAIWLYFLLERMKILLQNRGASQCVLTPNMSQYFGISKRFKSTTLSNGVVKITPSREDANATD